MSQTTTTEPKAKRTRSEQSRINGAKSKGPKTLPGKARCSLNAVKDATYADVNMNWLPIENGVLSGESRELAFGLFEAALAQFQPQSPLELVLVKKLTYHQCALDRLDRAESAMLQTHWNEVTPAIQEIFAKTYQQEPSRAVQTAHTINALATQDDKTLRTISRLRRDHERAINNYSRRIKDLRKNFPTTEPTELNPMELTTFYGLVPDPAPGAGQDQPATQDTQKDPAAEQSPLPAAQSDVATPTSPEPENGPKQEPTQPSKNQQHSEIKPTNSTTEPEPVNPPIAA